MKKKTLTNKAREVRELTQGDIKKFKSADKVLPTSLLEALPKRKRGQRGTQKKPTKELVTVRYSREVLEYFRSTGAGWQSRINEALKEWVSQKRL